MPPSRIWFVSSSIWLIPIAHWNHRVPTRFCPLTRSIFSILYFIIGSAWSNTSTSTTIKSLLNLTLNWLNYYYHFNYHMRGSMLNWTVPRVNRSASKRFPRSIKNLWATAMIDHNIFQLESVCHSQLPFGKFERPELKWYYIMHLFIRYHNSNSWIMKTICKNLSRLLR